MTDSIPTVIRGTCRGRTIGVGLLIAHAAATWFMVGLIWMVQTVHYPLFSAVGEQGFTDYERGHTARIGRLLLIPALAEIILAALIAFTLPSGVPLSLALASGAVLAFVWVLTALVQAPQHGALTAGFEPETHRRLVVGNWWRTAAWTTRGVLAAVMLA